MASKPIKKDTGATKGRRCIMTARQCQAVVAQLHRMDEIPESLRSSSRGGRLADPEGATLAIAEALVEVEESLQQSLRRAYAVVAGAKANKEVVALFRAEREETLAKRRQEIMDKKAAVLHSAKAVKCIAVTVAEADVAVKAAEADLKKMENKRQQIDAAADAVCSPLQAGPATGPTGRLMMKSLRKMGKEFGFHPELMSVLPIIARKQLDKRRTFDGLAIRMLGNEFQKRTGAVRDNITELERSVPECSNAARSARSTLEGAKEQHDTNVKELAEAEAALAEDKGAFAAARRKSSVSGKSIGPEKNLARVKVRYNKFRKGPLAAFERSALQSPKEVIGYTHNKTPVEVDDATSVCSDEDDAIGEMCNEDSDGECAAVMSGNGC